MGTVGTTATMEDFAGTAGLTYEQDPEIPEEGGLLGVSGRHLGAGAAGALPEDGGAGQIAFLNYTTTDSDNHTTEHHHTVVAARITESMGFAPYLSYRTTLGVISQMGQLRDYNPEGSDNAGLAGGKIRVFEGMSDDWLAQLFSPSLIDYVGRSPDDLSFELSGGVLCVARARYLTGEELQALWKDAGHLAAAIRAESRDEIESGTESTAAAKPARREAERSARIATALEAFGEDEEVPYLGAATPRFRSMMRRSPLTWIVTFLNSAVVLLILNIPGIALPIVLSVNGLYKLLAIIEGALFGIIFFFMLRNRISTRAEDYSHEAFFHAYARERKLKLEDPMKFAATHADAGLPFNPERVLTGTWPDGEEGSLVLRGDGAKREDRIAWVAGPKGPVADAELKSTEPGLSAKDLDGYAIELATKPAAAG